MSCEKQLFKINLGWSEYIFIFLSCSSLVYLLFTKFINYRSHRNKYRDKLKAYSSFSLLLFYLMKISCFLHNSSTDILKIVESAVISKINLIKFLFYCTNFTTRMLFTHMQILHNMLLYCLRVIIIFCKCI